MLEGIRYHNGPISYVCAHHCPSESLVADLQVLMAVTSLGRQGPDLFHHYAVTSTDCDVDSL